MERVAIGRSVIGRVAIGRCLGLGRVAVVIVIDVRFAP
jgi:hypothetical protein